jgi:hypothetical protein
LERLAALGRLSRDSWARWRGVVRSTARASGISLREHLMRVDTNVFSELLRPRPNANVVAWFGAQEMIHISVVTLEEHAPAGAAISLLRA